ncbi:MAG: outer membrane protein assembly factor BamD [Gemmatimonadales bacterium]|nr:outer membrane protein assembly factor BamD [Gemmatimonadales bacterium]
MRRYPGILLVLIALAGCGRPAAGSLPLPELRGPLGMGTSPQRIDSLYAEGERLFRSGQWRKAMEQFNQVGPLLGPEDPRSQRYRVYLGEAHYAVGEYILAAHQFRRIADESPDDPLAPDALFRAGMAYRQMWRKPQLDPTHGQTAQLVFAELLGRYPNSAAAARAQVVIRELQEWFAEKEYRNASFYLRYKAYESAILVLRELVATYPQTSIVPQALTAMVGAYVALGYEEDRQETCEYIREFYPATPDLDRICPMPAPPGGP